MGRSYTDWIGLFSSCHNQSRHGELIQWCWPFPGSLAEQPNHLIEIFNIIKVEAQRQIYKKIDLQQKNKRSY